VRRVAFWTMILGLFVYFASLISFGSEALDRPIRSEYATEVERAVSQDDVVELRRLIADGVNVEGPYLISAARLSTPETLAVLLEAGVSADYSAPGRSLTLLHVAAQRLDDDAVGVVEPLLSYGADPCRRVSETEDVSVARLDYRGMTPREIADAAGAMRALQVLAAVSSSC
jgi:hypothetical protein